MGCQQVFFSHETKTVVNYNPAWRQGENICCVWLIYGLKLISFTHSLAWNLNFLLLLFVSAGLTRLCKSQLKYCKCPAAPLNVTWRFYILFPFTSRKTKQPVLMSRVCLMCKSKDAYNRNLNYTPSCHAVVTRYFKSGGNVAPCLQRQERSW